MQRRTQSRLMEKPNEDGALASALIAKQEIEHMDAELVLDDEMVESALPLPNGSTDMDYMLPAQELAIAKKYENRYKDIEQVTKYLMQTQRSANISEKFNNIEIIENIGIHIKKMLETLTAEEISDAMLSGLEVALKNGDIRQYKEAAVGLSVLGNLRNDLMEKSTGSNSGKNSKIRIAFQNDSGQSFVFGVDQSGD